MFPVVPALSDLVKLVAVIVGNKTVFESLKISGLKVEMKYSVSYVCIFF